MPRNYTIDYIRLLSSYGVILIHLAPSSLNVVRMTQYFEISSVPFFLLTSLYLFQSKAALFNKINFSRILIPYISWSIIYLVATTAKHLIVHTRLNYDWFAIIFLGGAAVQLYFLPLLLCFLMAASVINTLFVDRDCENLIKFRAIIIILLLISASIFLKRTNYSGFSNDFIGRSLYYIFLSQAVLNSASFFLKIRKQVLFYIAMSALIIMLLAVEHKDFSILTSPLLSANILMACLMWPIYKVPRIIKSILSTTYGIYLCHHLFIEVIEFALEKLSIKYLPYTILSKLIIAFAVIVISIMFILFIRRWTILAFLLLGETKSNKVMEPV